MKYRCTTIVNTSANILFLFLIVLLVLHESGTQFALEPYAIPQISHIKFVYYNMRIYALAEKSQFSI